MIAYSLGATGATCPKESSGSTSTAGIRVQTPNQAGLFVPCDAVGQRPPTAEEIQQAASCAKLWTAYPLAADQYKIGRCGKVNFTTPSDFRNFYRDSAIEKLFSTKTGAVLVVKNNPTWLASAIGWLVDNACWIAAGTVVATGAGASMTVQAKMSCEAVKGMLQQQGGGSGGGGGSEGGASVYPPGTVARFNVTRKIYALYAPSGMSGFGEPAPSTSPPPGTSKVGEAPALPPGVPLVGEERDPKAVWPWVVGGVVAATAVGVTVLLLRRRK